MFSGDTTATSFILTMPSILTIIYIYCTVLPNAYTFVQRKYRFPHSNVILHDVLQQLLGGVDGDMLASLAPPVHLSGERLGWTLLVCMVSDFRRGRLQITWRSVSEGRISILPYSTATNRNHHGHNAAAAITVATRDWPSYSCSVSHRRHPKVIKRHQSTSPGRHVAE